MGKSLFEFRMDDYEYDHSVINAKSFQDACKQFANYRYSNGWDCKGGDSFYLWLRIKGTTIEKRFKVSVDYDPSFTVEEV